MRPEWNPIIGHPNYLRIAPCATQECFDWGIEGRLSSLRTPMTQNNDSFLFLGSTMLNISTVRICRSVMMFWVILLESGNCTPGNVGSYILFRKPSTSGDVVLEHIIDHQRAFGSFQRHMEEVLGHFTWSTIWRTCIEPWRLLVFCTTCTIITVIQTMYNLRFLLDLYTKVYMLRSQLWTSLGVPFGWSAHAMKCLPSLQHPCCFLLPLLLAPSDFKPQISQV